MPPVLGPSSPSKARLWSWAQPNSIEVLPSQSANSEPISPSRNSSITTRAPAAPKRPPSASSMAASASARVCGDHHALAGRQAVGLDHIGRLEARRGRPWPRRRPRTPRRRAVGRPWRSAEGLGEGLGGLQLRRRGARPEAGDAGLCQRVGEARLERRLGPDDHQVGGDLAGQGDQAVDVGRLRPRASRRARPCRDCRARRPAASRSGDCGDLPGQRVLAPAGADEEDVHRRRASRVAQGVKVRPSCLALLDAIGSLGLGLGPGAVGLGRRRK